MIFRQLFDPQSSTYSYILGDEASREAVIIDAVREQTRRDAALLAELGLELVCALETHVHADHVTGAWVLREKTGCRIAIAASSCAVGADLYLRHGDHVAFGRRHLQVRATPGHTAGCLSYVLDDHSMAFTGDCLLIRGSGRTDFQQGDAHRMFASAREQIFTLPETCLLYPAHDYRGLTASSVGEERRFNPRLADAVSEGDFVGYMENLSLPHPKQIDIAVPANLECGRPGAESSGETERKTEAPWAPLTYNSAGICEIAPGDVAPRAAAVQIVDVREPAEFTGPLGHIQGAVLIPLGELSRRTGELSQQRPIVAVCRSGTRSAQATMILRQAGFRDVANMTGGMMRWQAERWPVA